MENVLNIKVMQQNKIYIDPILIHSIKVTQALNKLKGPEVYQLNLSTEKRSINFYYYFNPVNLFILNQSKHKKN